LKRPLANVAALAMVTAGAWFVLTPQAQAACNPFAYTPTYSASTDVLKGTGGQGSTCGSGTSADVLLRHDRTWSPDTTMAQTSGTGNFSKTVSKSNPENGQYYTETRSSSGAKARSANKSVG
jgi:hypothetical protein